MCRKLSVFSFVEKNKLVTKPDFSDFASGNPRSFEKHVEAASQHREADTQTDADRIAQTFGYLDSAFVDYDEFIGAGKPIESVADLCFMDYMHNDLLGLIKTQVKVGFVVFRIYS